MRIAIVGTGISGLVCAHLLGPVHDITVFEAERRPGGHSNTVRVDLDQEIHMVDTGFIVYNERNYPGLTRLFQQLGTRTEPSDMSFSVSTDDGSFEFRGLGPNRLFAQRSNLLRPGFHRLLSDILRFNREARTLLVEAEGSGNPTLEQFLAAGGYSPRLRDHYVVPIGTAIWSADPSTFADMPARTFARFFHHHGLLGGFVDRPAWRTVVGGSVRYVEAIAGPLGRRLRLSTPVAKVTRRAPGAAEVVTDTGPESFDAVILATHSDQALDLLSDPTPAERSVLGALRYQPNSATLHTDSSVLPTRRRAWASWNYHLPAPGENPDRARLTYYMNRLQNLTSRRHICVTLNDDGRVDPGQVIGRYEYQHPVLDAAAVKAQGRRDEIQGRSGTYFAGAYWSHGFHEDGVQSAVDVCRHFGVTL